MAGKRDRAERLAALERRIPPSWQPGGRTSGDDFAEHGFSEAEMEREAEWVLLCLRLAAERGVEHLRLNARRYVQNPGEEAASRQRIADYEEVASEGAWWLHCRMEHGPGLV